MLIGTASPLHGINMFLHRVSSCRKPSHVVGPLAADFFACAGVRSTQRSQAKRRSLNPCSRARLPPAAMADFPLLTGLGFLFLTFNSGMAIYRSNGDAGSVAFVAVSYLDLVALFACLRYYERLDRHSPKRETVKAAVWGLTTLLTVMFSYKVAEIMPLPVKLVVWAMAAATSCGGFYAFFIHEDKPVIPAAPVPAAEPKDGA